MKKFAFILMGKDYKKEHTATFETGTKVTYICTVNSYEEAKKKVLELKENGVRAIELCGAFGKKKADELIELTNNEIAIGYVVHNKEQDQLFMNFFGN